MKRLFGWMVAAVLMLSAVCAAGAEGVTFKTPYFTLQLPDGWITDYEDLEKEEEMEDLGMCWEETDPGLVVVAYRDYIEELKDLSLWDADTEVLQEYIDIILESFEDGKPEHIDTVMVGRIPIVLIKGTDKDGDYLYAHTMTNGHAIQIEAYVTDSKEKIYPLTEENIEQFKSILATFVPVT